MSVNLQAAQIGFILSAKEQFIAGQGVNEFIRHGCDIQVVREKSHPLKSRFIEEEISSSFGEEGADLGCLFNEAINKLREPVSNHMTEFSFEIDFDRDGQPHLNWKQICIRWDICEQITDSKELWHFEQNDGLEGNAASKKLVVKALSVSQLQQIQKLSSKDKEAASTKTLSSEEIALVLRYWSEAFSGSKEVLLDLFDADFNGEIIRKEGLQDAFCTDVNGSEMTKHAMAFSRAVKRIQSFAIHVFKDNDTNLRVKNLLILKDSTDIQEDTVEYAGSQKWKLADKNGKLKFAALMAKEKTNMRTDVKMPQSQAIQALVAVANQDTVAPQEQDGWGKWLFKKFSFFG